MEYAGFFLNEIGLYIFFKKFSVNMVYHKRMSQSLLYSLFHFTKKYHFCDRKICTVVKANFWTANSKGEIDNIHKISQKSFIFLDFELFKFFF